MDQEMHDSNTDLGTTDFQGSVSRDTRIKNQQEELKVLSNVTDPVLDGYHTKATIPFRFPAHVEIKA